MSNVENRNAVTRFVYDIVFKGAVKAHEAVNKLASHDENDKVKDFNTTLMFAICKKYEFGWFLASFWVGDGAMCLFDEKTKTIKLLGTPDEGEFSVRHDSLQCRDFPRTGCSRKAPAHGNSP